VNSFLAFILGAILGASAWFIVSIYSTRASLRREAMPYEIKFLRGEKLSPDEARRLVEIHDAIERTR
jgi:hypothetical protein